MAWLGGPTQKFCDLTPGEDAVGTVRVVVYIVLLVHGGL